MDFDKCSGEVVNIEGSRSFAPHLKHHMTFLTEEQKQSSIATRYGDIAILTKDTVECENIITARGVLDIIERECVERTKCYPKEYFVIVDEWRCAEEE
ncbi:hypothetical protein ACFL38_05470 [Candidatus Omnitrophota bacterium]